MLTILLFLLLGMGVGFVLRRRRKALEWAAKAAHWMVYLLLFFLGLSVGLNDTVIAALGSLGVQALVLSVGAVVGSVLTAVIIERWVLGTAVHEK